MEKFNLSIEQSWNLLTRTVSMELWLKNLIRMDSRQSERREMESEESKLFRGVN